MPRYISPDIIILGENGVGKTSLMHALSPNYNNLMDTHVSRIRSVVIKGVTTKIIDNAEEIYSRNEIMEEVADNKRVVVLFAINAEDGNARGVLHKWFQALKRYEKYYEVQRHILVITKTDWGRTREFDFLDYGIDLGKPFYTSALRHEGIAELREHINQLVGDLIVVMEDSESIYIFIREYIDKICRRIPEDSRAILDIEWPDMERVVATTLESMGFSVTLTSLAKDGGKDIVVSCIVEDSIQKYYIEVKHWRGGGKPGVKAVSKFVEVNARSFTAGGLFLSSSGFTKEVYSMVGRLTTERIYLGDRTKIISLCEQYVKSKDGMWMPYSILPQTLFEDTVYG
jgi:HJR/Mrr/RecB family endonuclease